MSQLIDRLDMELATAIDRQLRAELLARKACALARNGDFAKGAELIGVLRSGFGDWTSGQTHVWIMIAEAVVNWFGNLSPVALDRITRAQVLSVAMRYEVGIATSAAWKAHIEFEMSNFDSMLQSLRLARSSCGEENSDASARIAIVICNSLSCCGEWRDAQQWFELGRKHALLDGDQASISALQYNRAALSVTWLRSEWFDGRRDKSLIKAARRELESGRNYSAMTGISALHNHQALCDARLAYLEERYRDAVEMLRLVRSSAPFASYHFSNQLIDVEIAYCLFKLRDIDAARAAVHEVNLSDFIDLDIDDRLVLVSMLLEMPGAFPEFGEAGKLAEVRAELKRTYDNSRSLLRDGIRSLLAVTPA